MGKQTFDEWRSTASVCNCSEVCVHHVVGLGGHKGVACASDCVVVRTYVHAREWAGKEGACDGGDRFARRVGAEGTALKVT